MTRFSYDEAVRAAVRIEDGRIVAAPFAADGLQTESSMDFGPVAGADLGERFAHISFVFDVPIEG